ncbi:two-component system regulatory protein YycI [Desulfuribacillus alkaliarsenatis]|uniref:Regulatory protein YycH-like domain-containing protein n=1 Tax=Desulfuribacillus alkaliarsenatis TaxID=766136 RepID=A0A1E5G2Z0_9FIRM|nr:two-component system regulatory protein YycI [Desulfuribacillus alkaliarsenatis]OEF97344.1 hypothetical protein BHF68_03800 [Desulfuribacillus alkaliarsenatis]
MDLARAKTILIIAFLVLNAILVYQLYLKQQINTDYSLLILEEINEVEQLLADNQIYLNQPIPTDIRDRPFLRINRESHSVSEIRDAIDVENNQLIVRIIEDNHIEYQWIKQDANDSFAYDVSSHSYTELPRKLLFEGASYRPHFSSIENGNGHIVYLQYFMDYPLFGITATAYVEENKITSWRQKFAGNIEAEDTVRPILTAATALRRITGEIESHPATIEKIELGYYSRFTESDSWLLPPVWGIILSTGEEFYINAFTGELEGLQEHNE